MGEWEEKCGDPMCETCFPDEQIPEREYTEIEEAGVHVCNDCGAYAESPEQVEHHLTCKPGESKRWEKFYEENPDA